MNIEVGNSTTELIEQLGMKLELYGGNLFEIAIQQRNVFMAEWILILILFITFTVICMRIKKYLVDNQSNLSKDDIGAIFGICGGLAIPITLIFLLKTSDMIQWVFNPEYAAIQEILSLVGRMNG